MSSSFNTAIPAALLKSARRVVTSHSIDGTFESCARRFEFMHMWQRSTDRERSGFAAEVGTALHEAVQEWSRYAISPLKRWPAKVAYEAGLMALAKWWPWVQEDYRKKEGLAIGERSLGAAILLFEEIISDSFWDDWELVHVEDFGPAIEVPWLIVHESLGTVPTPQGEEAYLCTQGKIDWILRHRRTGVLRIWDLKTTVKEIGAHKAAFKFSGQGHLYALILAHALGFDWAKQGLDMTYLLAYFGTAEVPMYVQPMHFNYSPQDIHDGINSKIERLSRMVHYARTGHWPRRTHGCDFYGRACGFLDICESRDSKYIEQWFRFEVEYSDMAEHKREYEPVWVVQA